jgi:hypothetical protein
VFRIKESEKRFEIWADISIQFIKKSAPDDDDDFGKPKETIDLEHLILDNQYAHTDQSIEETIN